MLFAELDANGWVFIIGAVVLGLQKLLSMILEYRRDKDQKERDEKAAAKVAEAAEDVKKVKTTLEENTAKQDRHMEDVHTVLADNTEKLNLIETNTNSLTDKLVEVSKVAAHAAGMQEERSQEKARQGKL